MVPKKRHVLVYPEVWRTELNIKILGQWRYKWERIVEQNFQTTNLGGDGGGNACFVERKSSGYWKIMIEVKFKEKINRINQEIEPREQTQHYGYPKKKESETKVD